MDAPANYCPECGAPAAFRGASVSLVCEYCGNTVVRTGVEVRSIGKVSAVLDNGSPVILGGRGRYAKQPFEIVGRLQLRHGRGTWNEWFLQFADGTGGWLADAQGSYSVLRPQPRTSIDGRVPAYSGLNIGQPLQLQGVEYVITEKRAATYQGAEGQLPIPAEPGRLFYSADLRGYKGEFATLDYGEVGEHQRPLLYTGNSVALHDLGLAPLRRFAGWPDPPQPRAVQA